MLGPREEEVEGCGPYLRTKLLPRIPLQDFSSTAKMTHTQYVNTQKTEAGQRGNANHHPKFPTQKWFLTACGEHCYRHQVFFCAFTQRGIWMEK